MLAFYYLVFLVISNIVDSSPVHPHRLSDAELAKIARDAFNKLQPERMKGNDEVTTVLRLLRSTPHHLTIHNSTALKLFKDRLVRGFDARYVSFSEPVWQKQHWTTRDEFNQANMPHAHGEQHFLQTLHRRTNIDANTIEDIHFLLWNMTRCTVEPLWKDFGSKVWPRYVNIGQCSNRTSCSIPPGMKCRPTETKLIDLLVWSCPRNSSTPHCYWTTFQTKITLSCQCSC